MKERIEVCAVKCGVGNWVKRCARMIRWLSNYGEWYWWLGIVKWWLRKRVGGW